MIRFVYKTTNLISGKIYIGQHTTENIDDGYLGSGVILQKAFKKYGKENFTREIIALVGTQEDLDHAEEFFIKHYRNKIGWGMMYNVVEGAFGGAPLSEEHKLKISEVNKGNQYFKDCHHTEETKKKISETHKNHPSFSKKVLCIETNTIYPSVKEAGRQTGINHGNISKVCRGKVIINSRGYKYTPTNAGGYHWKYIEE